MNADILVVGGGIAGMSVAWRLAAAGAKVTVLEAEAHCATHSTARSAATLTENYGTSAVRRLSVASRPFLAAPPPGFTDVPLLRSRGSLTVARAGEEVQLAAALAEGRLHVPAMAPLAPAEALRMVPVLRPKAVAAAFIEPDVCDIDVDALLGGYRRGLLAAGGTIVTDARATRIDRNGAAWLVDTPAGRFAAANLVNAAGAWADHVARLAGVTPVGLVPKRRTAVIVAAPDSANWPMVNDVTETLYFKPDAGRLMVSPADATPTEPCDAQPEELDVAIALDRLQQLTTLAIRHVPHRWAGLRTFSPDHSPVVGEDQLNKGFFWLAGQGGFGVMTSPALSAAGAAAVLGQGVEAGIDVNRPGLARAAP